MKIPKAPAGSLPAVAAHRPSRIRTSTVRTVRTVLSGVPAICVGDAESDHWHKLMDFP